MMRFGAAFWIQRTDWPALRDACLAVERAGWDSLFLDDHLLADEGAPDDPKLEGWSTLAAVAGLTERVRLGLLVSANTFRNPGLTAKLATTLDHVSAGRAILGLGGGWFAREHDAFGIDFGSGFGERLDRLDESVGLIRRLLDGETVTHTGRFYEMRDALCRPRPIQPRLPILIGGSGPRKTLRTTAAYADLWNAYGQPEAIATHDAVLSDHCQDLGRDEREIARTVTQDAVIRDTTEAALGAYDELAAIHGLAAKTGADSGAKYVLLAGPPADIADRLRAYEAVGVDEVIWIFRKPFDLETIERVGDVRAALAG
jgi:alkanesulfonate monooxygenase SsuD/methylene tetrahydromethanopterin reductase-like flavin-dependent oxidoreductase (luciferase family)